jgi:hypothetical protein
MMVATGEQGLSRRRAQCGGVQPGELRAPRGEFLEIGGLARPPEGAARAKTYIIDQNDQDVRRALGRPHILDWRVAGVRVLGVVGRQTDVTDIRDRQNIAPHVGLTRHRSVAGLVITLR